MVGLTRVVTTVQTVGFYSKIKDQPDHPFSTCNYGKGFYTDFGKAGNYIFDPFAGERTEEPVKPFALPSANIDMRRVFAYRPKDRTASHAHPPAAFP